MSLEWDGNDAETDTRRFKLVTDEETGKIHLRRKIKFNRGVWSEWAFCGEFDDIADATAHAEKM